MDRLLVEFPRLKVSHLEPVWAEKLILEPMWRYGISYAGTPDRPTFRGDRGPIPSALIELTDGNPYLIQVFCYKLAEHVRGRRRTIVTPEGLEQVVKQLLADEDDAFYLNYLTRLLPPPQRALLALLAGCEECWTREESLLGRPSLKLVGDEGERALEGLERQGLIATQGGPGEREAAHSHGAVAALGSFSPFAVSTRGHGHRKPVSEDARFAAPDPLSRRSRASTGCWTISAESSRVRSPCWA